MALLVELVSVRLPGMRSRLAGRGRGRDGETPDWSRFLALAEHHQVAALANECLREAHFDVPSWVADRLQEQSEVNARFALAQAAQTIALAKLFGQEGIPAIVLKGSILALRAYGNLGLRQHGDVDLLVPPPDIDRAVDLLVRNGYELVLRYTTDDPACSAYREIATDLRSGRGRRASDPSDLDPGHSRLRRTWAAFLELGNELSFGSAEHGSVDLHWKAFRNDRFFPVEVWSNRARWPFHGVELGVLSAEAEVIYLAAHGAGHGWLHLKWLVDLPYFISRAGPDLDEVRRMAGDSGLETLVTSALVLSHQLFGVPGREALEGFARQGERVGAVVAATSRRLFAQPAEGGQHKQSTQLLYQLRLRRDLLYRLRAVEDALAPANRWLEMVGWAPAGSVAARSARVARCVLTSHARVAPR